jgi:hypothetical protein
MNDALELLLKDTFDDDAQDAPAAVRLAEGARGRLRRRRRALGGAVAAAAAVVMVSALAWGTAGTTATGPGPSRDGGTTVVPDPPPRHPYCAAGSSCDQSEQIDELRRPLSLPAVPAGGACPVSEVHTMPKGGGFNTDYPAIGEGPFRATGQADWGFADPPPIEEPYTDTDWRSAKVIWHVDPTYSGPLLLRGARIDGPGELRFDRYLGALGQGDAPTGYEELAYPAMTGDPGLRTPPSGVYLTSPGCYAIQVDGTTFSQIIVFRAEFVPRP